MTINQHGAVAGKGTDVASHIFATMADIALMMGWSTFSLYLDIVKAFDKVSHRLATGWGQAPCDQQLDFLRDLGVSEESAAWIAEYLTERGPLFEQWGVPCDARDMIRTLREGAWHSVRGGTRRFFFHAPEAARGAAQAPRSSIVHTS